MRFPALGLAREALKRNGAAPTILNAANEIAVRAFLDGNVSFPQIAAIVSETLSDANRLGIDGALSCLDDVHQADAAGRKIGAEKVAQRRFAAA